MQRKGVTSTLTKVVLGYIFIFQKYLRACCTVIIMVLTLGVIIEESGDNTWSHSFVDGSYCNPEEDEIVLHGHDHEEECKVLRKADKWFYVMLFSADITLVLSIIVFFALFADWILFTAMVSNSH